jgi:hypothetical protein
MGEETLHLAVYARPLVEGGVEIALYGNDREGVRERQQEWSRWAEGLPKVGPGAQKGERLANRASHAESIEPREEQSEAEASESPIAEGQLLGNKRGEAVGADESRESKPWAEDMSGSEDKEKNSPGGESGRWASAAPWKRKVRIAPGKGDEEPNKRRLALVESGCSPVFGCSAAVGGQSDAPTLTAPLGDSPDTST